MAAHRGEWQLQYDTLHQPLVVTDPDGVSSYTCYQPDGQVSYTGTAVQHAWDGGSGCASTPPSYAVAKTYDADGNTLTLTTAKIAACGASRKSSLCRYLARPTAFAPVLADGGDFRGRLRATTDLPECAGERVAEEVA